MKILPNGLNDLFAVFKARLGDGNKNVVRLIVQLLGKFIEALGSNFKTFTKTVSLGLIGNLADKMQMLREDVLICMDKWVSQAGFESIIIYIPNFLKQDNFEMRTEILKFLHKYKEYFGKIDLKEFITPFLLCLQDKSNPIRNSVEELIVYTLKFIPLSIYYTSLKDYKPAIQNTIKQILDRYNTTEPPSTTTNADFKKTIDRSNDKILDRTAEKIIPKSPVKEEKKLND